MTIKEDDVKLLDDLKTLTEHIAVAASLLPLVHARLAELSVAKPPEPGPPVISALPDQTISEGGTVTVAFTVDDPDTPASQIVVTAISDDPVLVPDEGLILKPNGRNRSMTITPAAGQSGSCSITLWASDGDFTASRVFSLTVLPATVPPPPNGELEVIDYKLTLEPADGETVDLSGKLLTGLWSTPWPEDEPEPAVWPSHEELEDLGKPDSDERFSLSIKAGRGCTVRGGKCHHLLHWWAPWHVWKLAADSDGIRFEADGAITVRDMWVDNVTDGFNPRGNAVFAIQDCYATRIHDDCVENDDVCSGVILDSYFRGHTFYSARGASNPGAVVRIERCVVELLLQPHLGGSDWDDQNHSGGYPYDDQLGCGTLFKLAWDGSDPDDTHTGSGSYEIHDCVFLVPRHSSSSNKAMRLPHANYSNVTLVWLGEGDWPWPLPPGVTLTRDRTAFDAAKAAWFAAHPAFTGERE